MLYYIDACKKKKEKKKKGEMPTATQRQHTQAVLYKERATNSFLWPACGCTVCYIQLVNLQLLNHLLPTAVFRVPPLASNLWAAGVRALKLPLARIELLTQSKVQIFPRRSPIMTFSDSTQQQGRKETRGSAAAAAAEHHGESLLFFKLLMK